MRSCFLQVRSVIAIRTAGDEILTRISACDELVRLRTAHRSRRGFDDRKLNTAARENLDVRIALIEKRFIESGAIHIERVRVLHDESTQTHQARFRSWLIAKLDLNLIPNLRQLLVRADFVARDAREYFFVRHA